MCRPGSRAAAATDPASPTRSLPGTAAVLHERDNSNEGEVKKLDFAEREVNANRFFCDSHWLEIWKNQLCPSMGPNEGSVTMDSGPGVQSLKIVKK